MARSCQFLERFWTTATASRQITTLSARPKHGLGGRRVNTNTWLHSLALTTTTDTAILSNVLSDSVFFQQGRTQTEARGSNLH